MSNRSIWTFIALLASLALVVGARHLILSAQGTDISISLKEIHQEQGVVALVCPSLYALEGATFKCLLEGPGESAEIVVAVHQGQVEYVDPSRAAKLIARLEASSGE